MTFLIWLNHKFFARWTERLQSHCLDQYQASGHKEHVSRQASGHSLDTPALMALRTVTNGQIWASTLLLLTSIQAHCKQSNLKENWKIQKPACQAFISYLISGGIRDEYFQIVPCVEIVLSSATFLCSRAESPPSMRPKRSVSAAPSSGQSATTSTRCSAQLCSMWSSTAEVKPQSRALCLCVVFSQSLRNELDNDNYLS